MKKIPTASFTFTIVSKDNKKTLSLNARNYYQHFLNKKTKVGDTGTLELRFKKPTRTEQQLRYYWVIVGLICEHTGYEDEELHDALMKLKFGTKKIKLGKDIVEVRKSISNQAKLPKQEMADLIQFTLDKASELEIIVPSKESLGYINNH